MESDWLFASSKRQYNSESDCKSELKINMFPDRLLFSVLCSLAALPSFSMMLMSTAYRWPMPLSTISCNWGREDIKAGCRRAIHDDAQADDVLVLECCKSLKSPPVRVNVLNGLPFSLYFINKATGEILMDQQEEFGLMHCFCFVPKLFSIHLSAL